VQTVDSRKKDRFDEINDRNGCRPLIKKFDKIVSRLNFHTKQFTHFQVLELGTLAG
jgi:hypothetical protein